VSAGRGRAARVDATAKINLRLRVLAREASGYHQIETLFLRLALADEVVLRATGGARSLDVEGEVAPERLGPAERNLAWRAAEAYASATGWPAGFAIELTKRIPAGGGLGGGSADAGAVLRALDALAPRPVGERALLSIATRLGADVPFLATMCAFALAWGRGERLLALRAPAPREIVLLVPSFGVSTADAYGWLAAARAESPTSPVDTPVLDPDALSGWDTLAAVAGNDFEPVVARRHPSIASLVDRLRAVGCEPAMMSGSGSTVFGVLPPGAGVPMSDLGEAEDGEQPHVLRTRTLSIVPPVEILD
jgi:4-diphosphocytidyl-2-C-methyl-D-erythritol kinase